MLKLLLELEILNEEEVASGETFIIHCARAPNLTFTKNGEHYDAEGFGRNDKEATLDLISKIMDPGNAYCPVRIDGTFVRVNSADWSAQYVKPSTLHPGLDEYLP